MLHRPYDPTIIYTGFNHKRYATFAEWHAAATAATERLAQWIVEHPIRQKGESLPVESELYRAIKESLKAYFHDKCAYCESEFASVAWGDVEHYRPKRGVTGEDHKGYYWLAYSPSNLMPSCQMCNQGEGKLNQFPIGGQRARTSTDDLDAEAPLLLNPYEEGDCGDEAAHLHYEIDQVGWEVLPSGRVEGLTPRGIKSVEVYNLNRAPLVRRRRKSQDAAITKLRAVWDTPAWEQEWDSLVGVEQEHAAAVRAACDGWLAVRLRRLQSKYRERQRGD